jgi:epoxyqueuosine reductase
MKELLKSEAKRLGFYHCGIAAAGTMEHLRPFYTSFLQKGGAVTMKYLETSFEKRMNPALLLPGVKSVIALLMNYYPGEIHAGLRDFIISKYAVRKDAYPLIKTRMEALVAFLRESEPGTKAKLFIDSGPVLEKAWAQQCGVGWQGKNTLIIHKTGGSFFFIGIMLTDLELAPDPPATDHCGDCNRCREACPTGALDEPYRLDIARCISYHTIEHKSDIPAAVRDKMSGRIYGCDICQDVCPYNRFATPVTDPAFRALPEITDLKKPVWETMTEESFGKIFGGTPVARTGYAKMMKNAGMSRD